MTELLLPLITSPTTSTSFQIVYTYDGKNVSFVDSSVTVRPFCTSPCKRCSTLAITCVNCLPTPNTFIYFDTDSSTCLIECPNEKYSDIDDICQSCQSPCVNCLDIVNCSSCVTGTWLIDTDCIATCPDLYYNSSNGICEPCVLPCDTCQTDTECLSCATDFHTGL